MSAWAHLIAAAYRRRGQHELAAVWSRHAEALEAREQAERDRRPLAER